MNTIDFVNLFEGEFSLVFNDEKDPHNMCLQRQVDGESIVIWFSREYLMFSYLSYQLYNNDGQRVDDNRSIIKAEIDVSNDGKILRVLYSINKLGTIEIEGEIDSEAQKILDKVPYRYHYERITKEVVDKARSLNML